MAYMKKTWRFQNAVEVKEYHTGRYGAPGEKRRAKEKPTPEQVERYNQKQKEERCRHRLRGHFRKNDYLITLTYAKEKRPERMEGAKKDFRRFIRQIAKEYKEQGRQLKWIRNIEVGTKNAWHVHVVINRIQDTDIIVKRSWDKGKILTELLYEQGEFRDLAAYLTKTPKTDPRLRETSYSTSRNLPIPEPEKTIIKRWETWPAEVKIRKDTAKSWYVDKESMQEGVNRYGYRYRSYTILRYRRE